MDGNRFFFQVSARANRGPNWPNFVPNGAKILLLKQII
jgi:hypothetical protein